MRDYFKPSEKVEKKITILGWCIFWLEKKTDKFTERITVFLESDKIMTWVCGAVMNMCDVIRNRAGGKAIRKRSKSASGSRRKLFAKSTLGQISEQKFIQSQRAFSVAVSNFRSNNCNQCLKKNIALKKYQYSAFWVLCCYRQ